MTARYRAPFLAAGNDENRRRRDRPGYDSGVERPEPTEEQDGDELVAEWTYDPSPTPGPPPQKRPGLSSWVAHRF